MKWLRGIAVLLCAVAIGMLPALAETGGWDFGTFEDPQGPAAPAVEQPSEPETEEQGAAQDEPSQDKPQQETLPQPNSQDSWDDDIWGNWNGQTAADPDLESPSDAQREEEQKRLEQAQKEFEQRRNDSKEIRRIRHRVEFLETEIGKVEARMKDIEKILSNPGPDDDIMELTRTYLEDKRELDHKTAEWESLIEKLEE